MPVPPYVRKWFGLPSRIAVLLGIGAISAAASGQAEARPVDLENRLAGVPQQSVKRFGEMHVWSDGGRIYLSESGGAARELPLGDTAEARHLRQLLERDGAVAGAPQVLQHRIILVGGGGNGFHWSPGARQGSDRTNQNNGSATPGQSG
jgi:hypothetical protein